MDPPKSRRDGAMDDNARVATELVVRPIGFVRSPFVDRLSAPRQPAAARGVRGTIELLPDHNFEHGLSDLDAWDHIWIVFWFHLNQGWRPKVLPPRSTKRRGVFATRAPYRPNPIGLSVLALDRVEALTLYVRDVDLLDGTPVLDIKPYVPFTDVVASAKTGWLEAPDPGPAFTIVWLPLAEEQTRWLAETQEIDLVTPVTKVLAIGYEPHPYRRIRRRGEGFRLALKDWRIDFSVAATTIRIESIGTGYRQSQLASPTNDPMLTTHRAFVELFGSTTR